MSMKKVVDTLKDLKLTLTGGESLDDMVAAVGLTRKTHPVTGVLESDEVLRERFKRTLSAPKSESWSISDDIETKEMIHVSSPTTRIDMKGEDPDVHIDGRKLRGVNDWGTPDEGLNSTEYIVAGGQIIFKEPVQPGQLITVYYRKPKTDKTTPDVHDTGFMKELKGL